MLATSNSSPAGGAGQSTRSHYDTMRVQQFNLGVLGCNSANQNLPPGPSQHGPHSMESLSGGADGSPKDSSITTSGDTQNTAGRSSITEITRTGIPVDPK